MHKLMKRKNLLQENVKNESQHTNNTFAITHGLLFYYGVRECFTFRTSQRSNPKLQKSYFLPTLNGRYNREKLAKKGIDAGKLLDIEVIDHIIVTKNEYFRFKENSMI